MRKLLAGIILAAVSGCAVNPVTGDRDLILVSGKQELAMGVQNYAPMQQSQGGTYDVDPELNRYVAEVGQKVAAASGVDLPYEFTVLNNSIPNAWALPAGTYQVESVAFRFQGQTIEPETNFTFTVSPEHDASYLGTITLEASFDAGYMGVHGVVDRFTVSDQPVIFWISSSNRCASSSEISPAFSAFLISSLASRRTPRTAVVTPGRPRTVDLNTRPIPWVHRLVQPCLSRRQVQCPVLQSSRPDSIYRNGMTLGGTQSSKIAGQGISPR